MFSIVKLILITVFTNNILFSSALRGIDLKIIPERVSKGGSAYLKCNYDLEGRMLYAVKWYKGIQEFYRFTKHEEPHKKVFPTPNSGRVDLANSNDTTVLLTLLRPRDSGRYACEVQLDAPTFDTMMNSAVLIVSEDLQSAVQLNVPSNVKINDNVVLTCNYDVGTETLYSVKWYKGGEEFYRYIPGQKPSNFVFHVEGINVDLLQSNASRIVLTSVQLDTSGQYICEVSTDAPFFYTIQNSALLNVNGIPENRLTMNIEIQDDRIYKEGDFLEANCTIDLMSPPVELIWFHNDRIFSMDQETGNVYYNVITESEESEAIIIGRISTIFRVGNTATNIKLILQPMYFLRKELKLECKAKVNNVFNYTTERIIKLDQSEHNTSNVGFSFPRLG